MELKIIKLDKHHKSSVKKISKESMPTLTEKFYFRLALMFDNLFDFYVASYGDNIVGFISIIDTRRDGLVIGNIAVAEKYKRKGIASSLLETLLSYYKNHKITLQVRKSNLVAQNLYAKFGFINVDVIKNHYPTSWRKEKEDGIVMVRK